MLLPPDFDNATHEHAFEPFGTVSPALADCRCGMTATEWDRISRRLVQTRASGFFAAAVEAARDFETTLAKIDQLMAGRAS